jgi:hypothetical protein
MIIQENPPQELVTPEFAKSRITPQEIASRSYYFSLSWPVVDSWKQRQIGDLEAQACDAIAAEGFALLDAEEAKSAQ